MCWRRKENLSVKGDRGRYFYNLSEYINMCWRQKENLSVKGDRGRYFYNLAEYINMCLSRLEPERELISKRRQGKILLQPS